MRRETHLSCKPGGSVFIGSTLRSSHVQMLAQNSVSRPYFYSTHRMNLQQFKLFMNVLFFTVTSCCFFYRDTFSNEKCVTVPCDVLMMQRQMLKMMRL